MKPKHPLQPFVVDKDGTVHFKQNTIVRFLLEAGLWDMNKLELMNFTLEDREQFAQLIGYSLTGFLELPYVSSATTARVDHQREEFKADLRKEFNSKEK